MTIEVIGKAHREGTSRKTGNAYNFNIVYYTGPERGVIGISGQQIMLDPQFWDFNAIQVGEMYDVEFGPRGQIVSFQLAK